MYKNILLDLEFVEITDEKPIHFTETLTEYWNPRYAYSRFYKIEDEVTIELLIGNHRIVTHVNGICRYKNKSYRFQLDMPIQHLKYYLDMYLPKVKEYVKEHPKEYSNIEYNIDTSAGHPTFEGDDIVRTISKDIEL